MFCAGEASGQVATNSLQMMKIACVRRRTAAADAAGEYPVAMHDSLF